MIPFTKKSLCLAVLQILSQDDWTPYYCSHLTMQLQFLLEFFVGNECIRGTFYTYSMYKYLSKVKTTLRSIMVWWCIIYIYIIWSKYSDLTRPHPKWWFSKGNPIISGKSRLVKYYNLARYMYATLYLGLCHFWAILTKRIRTFLYRCFK